MKPDSNRWQAITESPHPWEREALAFVRDRLADHDPYHAWANFEFVTQDGRIYEVDLLVMTPKGLFLVEVKSRPGSVSGDAQNWVWTTDGREMRMESPLLLANRKAKCLKSLLEAEGTFRNKPQRVPFIEAAVFLSAPGVDVRLEGRALTGVHSRDIEATAGKPGHAGIVSALCTIDPADHRAGRGRRIDRPLAKLVLRSMEKLGIRAVRRERRVHDYRLGALLLEGPGFQDFEGAHASIPRLHRRVRIYGVSPRCGLPAPETIKRAARREYLVLHDLQHPGILRALDFTETEFGPALLFEHTVEPRPERLDYYLARRGPRLRIDARLSIVRQLAEALQYAHAHKLIHRGLSPESILVRNPGSDDPRLQVFNWQTAAREIASESGSIARTLTRHLDDLVPGTARIYLAPESLTNPEDVDERMDVFSLGAITYHVFANRPPAVDHVALHELIRKQGGLRLAADVDGACQALEDLVALATHASVDTRIESMREFLEKLEAVEEQLTAPDEETVAHPAQARRGDRLEGGYMILNRLGSGSTSIVYEVEVDGEPWVLKVARDPDQNERLEQEASILERLRYPQIVDLERRVEIGGHTGLLLSSAGKETLRDRLRPGALSTELLQRFGVDLLEILRELARAGVNHRDLKPENLGVRPVGRGDALHLVLFDFSLSRVPLENLSAGTPGYIDPFLTLRPQRRWDEQAEYFSAAVILYEMATGRLPSWGDGKSDPSLIKDEVTIEVDLIDAPVRRSLKSFFAQALRRDPRERFDNVEEMLRAWKQAFEDADRTSEHGDEDLQEALAKAALDLPIVTIPFSARAQNAMERANILTVRDLLRANSRKVVAARGVGAKTRKEILGALQVLATRFPREERDAAAADTGPDEDIGDEAMPLEHLARRLITSQARARKHATEYRAARALLGFEPVLADVPAGWAGQADIATALGVTRARIGQIVKRGRERWQRLPAITALRNEIVDLLGLAEGVLTADEVVRQVARLRGGHLDPDQAASAALAVVRAATEVETRLESPRWVLRRSADRILLVLESAGGSALADYVCALGDRADRLAREDPLPSPQRIESALREVPVPAGVTPFTHHRLVERAAAASRGAAASPRLELYPEGMEAERALRLARGTLVGRDALTVEALRQRVQARYPGAQRLPDRPELDQLLAGMGLDLRWTPEAADGAGAYVTRTHHEPDISPSHTTRPRYNTLLEPVAEVPQEIADARQFEERLLRSLRDGAFLVLCAPQEEHARIAAELTRERFGVSVVRLDALLLRTLREVCDRRRVQWEVVLAADAAGPGGRDWRRLLRLVGEAVDAVLADLLAREGTVLLTDSWLLGRYEGMSLVERLRDAVGARTDESTVTLRGLWLLLGQSADGEAPLLAGQPVPLLMKAQWANVPKPWTDNRHRAGRAGLAASGGATSRGDPL